MGTIHHATLTPALNGEKVGAAEWDAAHTFDLAISDVTGLQAALDAVGSPNIADISGLTAALDAKADDADLSGYVTTGALTTALAAKQDTLGFTPYNATNPDGFITAAALSGYATTAAVAAGYQPLDADLTAIAGVSTASYGRSLLTLADLAAAQTALGITPAGSGGTTVANGLVSGGGVFYETGALTFRVAAAVYYIDGVRYTSAEQTITLDAADATNPRIDVLALNTSGTLVKVTGTAAATPSEPDVDPSTQLKLTFVLVPAAATTLNGITNENIYLENTEWTSSTSGSGFNANSSTNPYAGTKTIEGTTVANNAYVQLQRGSSLALDSYTTLGLFVRSKGTWASGRVLRAQFYLNGVAKGSPVTIASGYWGFDSSITAGYQLLAVPVAQFVLPAGTLVNQLRITDVGGSIGFYIDNIVLQGVGTTAQAPSSGLTQAQADARYYRYGGTDVALADGGTGASTAAGARTNLGLGTIAVLDETTTAQYRANTADKALSTDQVWAAADYVALTDAATVAVDMSTGFNFSLTIGGNRTLGAPSNTKNGQSGAIVITQDGTGSRTLGYHANWKFAGGTDPTLSTAAGAVDVLFYQVISSTSIVGNLVKAIA